MIFKAFVLLVWIAVALPGNSQTVPPMYIQVAKQSQVPHKVLFAIALNESRSRTGRNKPVLPWPWTINHRGQPHFFATRQEAFQFAADLVIRGDEMFDVGLGQVNWYWNKGEFDNLWIAFDPMVNLTVSARLLRRQYERPECQTWALAIGCYHRPGQRPEDLKIADAYRQKVIQLWKKL